MPDSSPSLLIPTKITGKVIGTTIPGHCLDLKLSGLMSGITMEGKNQSEKFSGDIQI